MPSNNGTNTYQRVTQMAHTAVHTGEPARYVWDNINSSESAEVAAAEALAGYWRTGHGDMNYPNEIAKWLRNNGHGAVSDDIRLKR